MTAARPQPYRGEKTKMRIVADTPTLYSPAEGEQLGITVVPACTIIGDEVYRDLADITLDELMEKIRGGAVPKTSQPSIGDIVEVFEACDEEMLVLPIGDGLSGTYQNMLGARGMVEGSERIHVVDTKTLAGPQRYLVQKAMKLREMGMEIERIKEELRSSIESSVSFVIPADFDFLKRSGRLTPVAAKIGTILKIVPVLTQTEDKKKITIHCIKRTEKKAVQAIIDHLKSQGVDENWLITVTHGGVPEKAKAVLAQLKEQFSQSATEMFGLVPSLVSHGGPGCIVVQSIRM